MKDLTIPRWIKLARKLAKREPLWNKFVGFMYMGEDDEAPLIGYDDDDDDMDVGLDVKDWQEDDPDEDDADEDDADEDEWEVPQERQWSLPTNLREDEDDLLP